MPLRQRIEKNERLFREVNERIKDVGYRLADDLTTFDFFCECAEVECTNRLTLTLRQYDAVRANDAWFAVLPGHEVTDLEHVVERHETYSVIEKPWLAS